MSIPQKAPLVKRLAGWIAARELILIALAAPFLLFPNRWTLPAFGLVLLAWLARAIALGRLTLPTTFDLPLAILLLSALVGFLVSPDPDMSRAKLWGIVLQIALFYAVANAPFGPAHPSSRLRTTPLAEAPQPDTEHRIPHLAEAPQPDTEHRIPQLAEAPQPDTEHRIPQLAEAPQPDIEHRIPQLAEAPQPDTEHRIPHLAEAPQPDTEHRIPHLAEAPQPDTERRIPQLAEALEPDTEHRIPHLAEALEPDTEHRIPHLAEAPSPPKPHPPGVDLDSVDRPRSWPAFQVAAMLLVALAAGAALLGLVGTDWGLVRLVDLPQIYQRLPNLVRGLPGSGVPAASTLFHPREVGATLALLLPVPAALLFFAPRPRCRRDRFLRGLSLVTLVIGGTTFVLCQSIQATAGLAAALLLIAVWRTRWALLAVPLASLALEGVILAYGPRRAALALLSLDHPIGIGVVLRWDIWSRAWAMVHDAPFTGVGLNTYPVVQTHFYPGFLLGPEVHAHQLFLGTAVDLGLPGLLALLWLLVAFYSTVVRAYRLNSERDLRVLLVGLAAGVPAYVVHGLVDTVSLGAKPVAALFIMFGLAAALQLRGERAIDDPAAARETPRLSGRWASRLRRILPLASFFLLPLLACALLAPGAPARNLGVLRAHQALVQARASHLPPAAGLQAAVGPLEQALVHHPDNVYVYSHLGSLYAWLGDYPAALAALQAGVNLDASAPMERYAPFESLRRRLAGETGQDPLADLLLVYRHWQNRYPDRAEGYVRTALIWDRHRGDPARARQALQAGLDRGAEPAGLLAYYLSRLQEQP